MNSWEWNKVFGALLAVLTFALGLKLAAGALFAPKKPEKLGYAVAVAESAGDAKPGSAEAADPPVSDMLTKADAARGQTLFKTCAACHTADKGGPNRVGPNLWDVVGGPRLHKADFNYSAGMKAAAAAAKGTWDYAALYEFLKAPRLAVPGTTMGFAGLKKPQDRADLIAYLRNQSDSPKPLP